MSLVLYHDEKGRLKRVPLGCEDIPVNVISLHLDDEVMIYGGASFFYMGLISVSLVFKHLERQEQATVCGLYHFAPNLERLSVKLTAHRPPEPARVSTVLAPLHGTKIHHLSFYSDCWFYRSPLPPSCFSRLHTLQTNLPLLPLTAIPFLRQLRWQNDDWLPGILSQNNFSSLQELHLNLDHADSVHAINWLHFSVICLERVDWLFLSANFLSNLDKRCRKETGPLQVGIWMYYKVLRKRLANRVLGNRHVYRSLLKRILFESAQRCCPVFAESIQDISVLIFSLLRLLPPATFSKLVYKEEEED